MLALARFGLKLDRSLVPGRCPRCPKVAKPNAGPQSTNARSADTANPSGFGKVCCLLQKAITLARRYPANDLNPRLREESVTSSGETSLAEAYRLVVLRQRRGPAMTSGSCNVCCSPGPALGGCPTARLLPAFTTAIAIR